MLQLLQAQEILKVGLTVSQVFYLVGCSASKKLCRFVKSDALKCAIATLLGINGRPNKVEDIRMTDGNGLKVWTNSGTEFLPGAEVCAFLTRYNRLAREGCTRTCNCAQDASELWKKYCVHRIAAHLESVKEKLEVAAQTAKAVAVDTSLKAQINQLIYEAKHQIHRQNLTCSVDLDWGDILLEIFQQGTSLGHMIITREAELKIVPLIKGAKEQDCATVVGAIASLKLYAEHLAAG